MNDGPCEVGLPNTSQTNARMEHSGELGVPGLVICLPVVPRPAQQRSEASARIPSLRKPQQRCPSLCRVAAAGCLASEDAPQLHIKAHK